MKQILLVEDSLILETMIPVADGKLYAGYVCQNLYLSCEEIGAGTCWKKTDNNVQQRGIDEGFQFSRSTGVDG